MKFDYDGKIPFSDLSDQWINGPAVKIFEDDYARFCDTKCCVGCSSGTSAIHLALLAIRTKPGDEVITVPNTFVGTIEPVVYTGASIKFVDVMSDTALMNIDLLEKAITKKTKAVIVVDLYGQMPDMQRIKEIGDKHGVYIIEDACQAHGAKWNGHPPGHYSDFACYSFYPSKNLGCHGDGGAVTTNDIWCEKEMRMFLDHGRKDKHVHRYVGYNYRLDTIQAEVLDMKLKGLSAEIDKKRIIARFYDKHIPDHIIEDVNAKHVYHQYVIKVKQREQVIEFLFNKGIGTGVHYPIPLHLQPAYGFLGFKEGCFPVSEQLASEVVSIPVWPGMTRQQCVHVVRSIKEVS